MKILTQSFSKRIEEQLRNLNKAKAKFDVEPEAITKHQQLQMCLYLIERDFHFAGDGVWMEPIQTADFTGADSQETEFEMLGNYKAKTRTLKKRNLQKVSSVPEEAVSAKV